jgi:uncharacterized protein YggT (Ycf19 family)
MLAFGMPAAFTREDVARIAALARLELDVAEIDLLARLLGDILAYAEQVQQIDTTGVAPTAGVLTGNPKVILGFILYGLLSLLVLFIFLRFLASWFVFTQKTFFAFVMRVTNPIMIPVQRLIPPIGMFDISAMLVLIVINVLQSMILNTLVRG